MSRPLFTKQKLSPIYKILFEQLKKRCKLWTPTSQREMGWAPDAGRHSDVLSLVDKHWFLTSRAIEPGEVAEAMAEELGNNARQKTLQALDALVNKRLVDKLTRSDNKRGKVVSFQLLKTRRCA